jgi:hypothetical protein
MLRHRAALLPLVLLILALVPGVSRAGVTNPQISIIGQPFAHWTDDPSNPDRGRLTLDPGETEIVYDDYLNPYARGYFTLALGPDEAGVEEAFFTLFRGLPLEIALKGGKYHVPFGRLNPDHPHTYPFSEGMEVLGTYLPGEESFNETGIDLSRRIPVAGDFSINLQLNWLQGNSMRLEREASDASDDPLNEGGDDDAELTRPTILGRVSGFTMVGERSALEFGITAAQGTNNVAAGTRSTLLGADIKAKLWRSERAYLLIQAEGIRLDREEVGWEPGIGYTSTSVDPVGGYLFADYNFDRRYNVGASYERFQEPVADKPWSQAFGAFAGLALMEETTVFRLDWKRFVPDEEDAFNALTLRVIYSLGPHKAHQF